MDATNGVVRLNPNFEVAAFESLHGELHLGEVDGNDGQEDVGLENDSVFQIEIPEETEREP